MQKPIDILLLYPSQIESIMDTAGKQMDGAVRGLCTAEVALRLGMGRIHGEVSGECSAVEIAGLTVGKELTRAPGLTLIL